MFFKKQKALNDFDCLVKLYVHVPEENLYQNLISLVEFYGDSSGLKLIEFSINYRKEKSIVKFSNKDLDVNDLEVLTFYSENPRYLVNIGKLNLGNSIFEISFVFPRKTFDSENESLMFAKLAGNLFRVKYGYFRLVSQKTHPLSETPIKKSMFGLTTSIELKKFGSDWYLDIFTDLDCGFKGVYPVNFLNEKSMNNDFFKKLIDSYNVELIPVNKDFSCLKISGEVLKKLKNEKSTMSEYVNY